MSLIVASSSTVKGATATGTSGKPGAKPWDSGGNDWVVTTPTAGDTISFSSGVNSADATAFPSLSYGPFTKFGFPGPVGRTVLPAYTRTDSGPRGSKAFTGGNFSSASGTDPLGLFTAYYCGFNVSANGKLGPAPPVDWRALSRAFDPWSTFPSDLAHINDSIYDLFFIAGLKDGDFSPNGEIGLQVSYETTSGTINLLEASLQPSQVLVSGDAPPGLGIYRLADEFEGPTLIQANLMSYSQIQTALATDVVGDNTLNQPMILGFYLHGIEKPTIPMGDGAVARVHASVYALDWDAAEVPEPSCVTLVALCTTCLFLGRRMTRTTL
jgi:hypothetical protein